MGCPHVVPSLIFYFFYLFYFKEKKKKGSISKKLDLLSISLPLSLSKIPLNPNLFVFAGVRYGGGALSRVSNLKIQRFTFTSLPTTQYLIAWVHTRLTESANSARTIHYLTKTIIQMKGHDWRYLSAHIITNPTLSI